MAIFADVKFHPRPRVWGGGSATVFVSVSEVARICIRSGMRNFLFLQRGYWNLRSLFPAFTAVHPCPIVKSGGGVISRYDRHYSGAVSYNLGRVMSEPS